MSCANPAVEVHSEALRRRWVAPLCSLAGFLSFLLVAGAGVLPLYVAWGSGPFWLKDVTRYEQPAVAFASRLVVQLSGSRAVPGAAPGQRVPFQATWTTSAAANALLGDGALRAAVVRASARDGNLDGVNDEVLVSASMPLAADEIVTAATLCLYFGVNLQVRCRLRAELAFLCHRRSARARLRTCARRSVCRAWTCALTADATALPRPTHSAHLRAQPPLPFSLSPSLSQSVTMFEMDALVVAAHASGFAASRLDLDGDLVLVQRQNLPVASPGTFAPYLGSPLPSLDAAETAADVLPPALLAAARERNFSLRLDVAAPLWTPDAFAAASAGSGAADLTATLATQPREFTVALTARVPTGAVWLRPKVSEELRWGWMQYLSFLVLSHAVAWCMRWALFGLGIFETSVVVDAPRAASKLHLS